MEDEELVRPLLWLGIEDYAGLWEAVWELNTRRPEQPEPANRLIAERILRELLDAGHIRLFKSPEPYGDVASIPLHEAEAALGRCENWAEPRPNGVSVRFSTTPSGEALYNVLMERRRQGGAA